VSRAAGDMLTKIYRETFALPVVSTRAANVYGPGQPLYRIIPRTIFFLLTGRMLELHGGGDSTRSFIHIDDVSRATWQIAQHASVGETYHISTDHIIAIKDIVALICEKLNKPFEPNVKLVGERLGKDSAYLLKSTKLRSELGWTDTINLAQGVDRTIQWALTNLESLKNQPQDYVHRA
jgi:dTDP-glucose 4,6-dehydratase